MSLLRQGSGAFAVLFVVACGGDDGFFGESASATGAAGSSTGGSAAGGSDAGGSGVGASGGGASGSGGGAGSGGSGASGGQGGASTVCAAATRAAGASTVLLWSTLDDAAAITTPQSGEGNGAGTSTTPADDFVPALSGNGILIDASGEWARWRQTATNIALSQGTIDFCYQPLADQSTDQNFSLFGVNVAGLAATPAFIRLRKAATDNANALQLIVSDGTSVAQWEVPSSSYTLAAATWYRVTVSWSFGNGGVAEAHLYIDGVELVVPNPPVAVILMPPADPNAPLYAGAFSASASPGWYANGVIDELVIHDAPIVP